MKADLIPWEENGQAEPLTRYRSLSPGSGYYVAIAWWIDDSPTEIEWLPVTVFAIKRLPDEDDVVVPLIVQDSTSGILEEPHADDCSVVLGLYTAGDTVRDKIQLLRQAETARTRHKEVAAMETKQREEVMAFVSAQPDPGAFARSMRAAGCGSLSHAWLAIQTANGDEATAIRYARIPYGELREKKGAFMTRAVQTTPKEGAE